MRITNMRYFVSALVALVLAMTAPALCDTSAGTWSITPSTNSDQVHLEFRFSGPGYDSNDGNDIALSALGLTKEQLQSSGQRVHFTLAREAGSFDCTGWASNGSGGGPATFTPNPDFLTKMRALGYDDISARMQMTSAMIDLTTSYVADIVRAGYPHLDFNDLVAFRALHIDAAFIDSIRAAFNSGNIDARDMIALMALHVTPDYVSQMRGAGMTIESPHDAVSMKALQVDLAYIRELAAAGYPHLTSEQIIQLRAMHIDSAFIAKVRAHGLGHPTVEELVRLKALNIV
jgi:hypothetical protein